MRIMDFVVVLGKVAKKVPEVPLIPLRDPCSCFRACWLANGQYNGISVSEFSEDRRDSVPRLS